MPTECERKSTSLGAQNFDQNQVQEGQTHLERSASETQQQRTVMNDHLENIEGGASAAAARSPSVDSIASPTTELPATNGLKGSTNTNGSGEGKKTSLISPDPTSYVTKARVTRPIPPPPSYNPMQFVQIKPCNLYQQAQEQLKKAEEVKKIKEVKKEEPEDWQNNLDNWKSSRRKRVEHIIDRVVEVKKLELEEHDRSRRKSKTFSEMIEERGERAGGRALTKLKSLAVYKEDEANDLSDLGIGTSSASGKSSLSEDYDNNSVTSDNPEADKAIKNENNHHQGTSAQRIASPGYETSSSTAPASSPDPCEYTYEGAIQDYKQRISRAAASGNYKSPTNNNSHDSGNNTNDVGAKVPPNTLSLGGGSNNNKNNGETYSPRRGNKIEDRLLSFEVTSPSDHQEGIEKVKVDVPKIDILKRKEIFESQEKAQQNGGYLSTSSSSGAIDGIGGGGGGVAPKVTLRERFKYETNAEPSSKKDIKRLSGDVSSIRERLQSLEQQKETPPGDVRRSVDIPVPPLKDRLSSLQNAAKKEEVKKPPVVLVDARQLEIMKNEEETAKQRMMESTIQVDDKNEQLLDDSGIQTNEQEEVTLEEKRQQKEQEEQLNAAIAALALEEQQLEAAANAVNKIEAEFEELSTASGKNSSSSGNAAPTNQPPQLPYEMDFSINEALELALEAIDKETNSTANVEDQIVEDGGVANVKTETENKKENETANQINKSNRINEGNTGKKKSSLMEGAAEIMAYVPQKTTTEFEPIYENVSSVTTTTTKSSVEEHVGSVIIPNGAKVSNDNNNDNNKHHELHHHHNNHNYESNPHQLTQQQQQPTNHHNKNNSSSNQSNQNNFNNNIKNNQNICFESITTTSTSKTTLTTKTNNQTTTTTTTTTPTETKAPINQKKPFPQQSPVTMRRTEQQREQLTSSDVEPYYQVPKSSEPYYDAPKHLRPVPLYENIEVFYNGVETISALSGTALANGFPMEPPKEKPPPPPAESPPPMSTTTTTTNDTDESVNNDTTDTWSSSDNTYETISTRHPHAGSKKSTVDHPSPPIKRVNSTKRIKKEIRNKRSSFLGIDASALDDEEHYLEMTVAPPPDMAQFLQQERQLEKQLYMKAAGLCDSSDTGESRDSGVSENHSRQSSEHYTNSSEENERHIDVDIAAAVDDDAYHSSDIVAAAAAQTPLLQTVKGDSAESWTESATAAAAASQSLTEATATANAKMLSIEEKIREQEEVLRVERELLQLEQEELKRQRENLMLRENMARRELQHGAKMLMSANRRSLQELNGNVVVKMTTTAPPPPQQIYANVPSIQQQYYQMDIDYRKSMSDLNEFTNPATTKRTSGMLPPTPPTKPLRSMHGRPPLTHAHPQDDYVVMTAAANQRFGGSLVKIAAPAPLPTAAPRSHIYSNFQHRSQQNLCATPQSSTSTSTATATPTTHPYHGNMTRNTLHALSATPKPKYTDGWVLQQQQHQSSRNSLDPASHLASDPAWLSAYQQKRKSMPDAGSAFSAYNGNHWLVQEAEQRRIAEEQRRSLSNGSTPLHQKSNGKPLPDAIIQTLTERVQSKGIGERKRLDNFKNTERSPLHAAATYQQQSHFTSQQHHDASLSSTFAQPPNSAAAMSQNSGNAPDKVLSVSGKKKCSHCGDELGRGAAMIIESLLLFYHINCFKCCVCHVQLGDGLNGTDVRVRNHKLHCQNCYSSDDGIKFSCV